MLAGFAYLVRSGNHDPENEPNNGAGCFLTPLAIVEQSSFCYINIVWQLRLFQINCVGLLQSLLGVLLGAFE